MNLEVPRPPVADEEKEGSEPSKKDPTKEVKRGREEEEEEEVAGTSSEPKQQYLSLDKVEYIVVDEADLMLDISFFILFYLI